MSNNNECNCEVCSDNHCKCAGKNTTNKCFYFNPDILRIIGEYRCSVRGDENGDGIELSDVIAHGFGDKDIGDALKELESLADHIFGRMFTPRR